MQSNPTNVTYQIESWTLLESSHIIIVSVKQPENPELTKPSKQVFRLSWFLVFIASRVVGSFSFPNRKKILPPTDLKKRVFKKEKRRRRRNVNNFKCWGTNSTLLGADTKTTPSGNLRCLSYRSLVYFLAGKSRAYLISRQKFRFLRQSEARLTFPTALSHHSFPRAFSKEFRAQ